MQVLPDKFIYFVEPDVHSIEAGLSEAIADILADKRPDRADCHAFVRHAYDWRDIARRTEIVYDSVIAAPSPSLSRQVRNLWERGRVAGPLMACLFLFCHYWIMVLDWLQVV